MASGKGRPTLRRQWTGVYATDDWRFVLTKADDGVWTLAERGRVKSRMEYGGRDARSALVWARFLIHEMGIR